MTCLSTRDSLQQKWVHWGRWCLCFLTHTQLLCVGDLTVWDTLPIKCVFVCVSVHSVRGLVCLLSQHETLHGTARGECVSQPRMLVEECSRFCFAPSAAPAWGSAPSPSAVHNINADHRGSTHNGPNCRLQFTAGYHLQDAFRGNKKTLTLSWSPEKVVPIYRCRKFRPKLL